MWNASLPADVDKLFMLAPAVRYRHPFVNDKAELLLQNGPNHAEQVLEAVVAAFPDLAYQLTVRTRDQIPNMEWESDAVCKQLFLFEGRRYEVDQWCKQKKVSPVPCWVGSHVHPDPNIEGLRRVHIETVQNSRRGKKSKSYVAPEVLVEPEETKSMAERSHEDLASKRSRNQAQASCREQSLFASQQDRALLDTFFRAQYQRQTTDLRVTLFSIASEEPGAEIVTEW